VPAVIFFKRILIVQFQPVLHLFFMKPLQIILLLFMLCNCTADAQVISGKVINRKTGEPIQAAFIAIEEKKINAKQQFLQTDINGYFSIQLKPAKYRLRIQMPGSCDTVINSIELKDTSSITIEARLPLYCRYEASEKNNSCPVCKKKRNVIPVLYGLPAGEMDEENYYYAGCEITCCDPHWYCKKDKITF
jgi:hypothetical protein